MKRALKLHVVLGLILSQCVHAEEIEIMASGQATHNLTGITIVSGTLEVPAQGYWTVPAPFSLSGSITQIFLQPPQDWIQRQQGRRLMQIQHKDRIRQGRSPLHRLYWALMEHARNHEGVQSTNLQELTQAQQKDINDFTGSPYQLELDVQGAAYVWLPGIQLNLTDDPLRIDPNAEPEPMVVEVQPYCKDGEHWVLYTNGDVRRVEIDEDLMAQYHLTVTPLREKPIYEETLPSSVTYQVYGLKIPDSQEPARFEIQNLQTQETLNCRWNPTPGNLGQETIRQWANLRQATWGHLIYEYDAPILKQWTVLQQRLYDTDQALEPRRPWQGRNRDRQINMFGVLGGQAALQETFQLQSLEVREVNDTGPVPIDQIEGVTVKSHPFKEMLGANPGGQLPLANLVPDDCLMAHFPKPQALEPFMGSGSDFLSHLGSLSLGRSLDYGLVDRYLQRLGLTRELLKQLMKMGALEECIIFTPDLFFIDGTDLAIVARAPQFHLLTSFLQLIGLELSPGNIVELPTLDGGHAYWSLQDDLVLISTHRSLLNQALHLKQNQGQGSLGQSDEFKYMLTQLPPTERTRAFLYFSDPFIRRLVSPATKIGQLRRLQTRVNMNQATSAALLYQLDQQVGFPTVTRLMKLGYLPADFDRDDVQLEPNLMAISKAYGPNCQLKSLMQTPVNQATAIETQAYGRYVEAYSRYWRQFFDPIAVRLDETPDQGLELTTFILPLLDSWLYTQVRECVPGQQGPTLRIPQIEPAPIALFSLNLSEKMWMDFIGDMIQSVSATDTSFVDDFGPALHLAIQDADPVIAFGGGDLLGIAGQMNGFNEMMMIPMIVSLLTRPCAIFIETQNQDDLIQFLEQGGLNAMFIQFANELGVETYRLTDRDAWILCVDLFGMAKLRFGIAVQDNYLIVTNQPWSQQLSITGTSISPLNDLALRLEPTAAQEQLAAMFTSAMEKQRRSALQGQAMLTPLIWSGTQTIADALDLHQQLFGFAPKHPGTGNWQRNDQGHLVSSDYGSPYQAHQPGYNHQPAFGLLQGINPLEVSLQIEDTGLRTRIYWRFHCDP